jgi:hypothetical protein
MTGRRRRSTASLVILLLVLLMCIWLLYKLFIGLPAAPAPKVEQGTGNRGFGQARITYQTEASHSKFA